MAKSDLQIAQEATLLHVKEVAAKLDIEEDDLEYYGKYKFFRRVLYRYNYNDRKRNLYEPFILLFS